MNEQTLNPHPPVEIAAPATTAAPSQGQKLIDTLNAQSIELVLLHRLVAALSSGVTGTPAASVDVAVKIAQPAPRKISFFAGIDLVKRNNETAIAAMRRDIEELARIFAVDLSAAIAEHREEESHVGASGG
jgi:hypothetical protein